MNADNATQVKLLCALVGDPDFFRENIANLHRGDFPYLAAKLVFETVRAHWRLYGALPTAKTLPDEVLDAMRGIGPDGKESILTSIPKTLLHSVASCLGKVVEAINHPDPSNTAYFRDRWKDYLSSVRIERLNAAGMSAKEQLEEAAKLNEEIERISGGRKSASTSARKRVVSTRDSRKVRFGTGVWPIDIRMKMGMELGELGCILAGTGTGKALVNSDVIPTPQGFRKVGGIREGEYLFGHDGKPVRVLRVHPQPNRKRVWVVSLFDGRKVRCCGEHNWEVWYDSHRKQECRVMTASELYEHANKLGGFRASDGKGFRFKIRMNGAVEYPETELPVDPYVLGVAIGNGSVTKWQFVVSAKDSEVPDKVASILGCRAVHRCEKNYNWIFETETGHHLQNREVLTGFCADMIGCHSHEKFIPAPYLVASKEQRMRLLNGLLDTDGSISKEKGKVVYSTTSPQLAKNIVDLCFSLGMTAKAVPENRTRYKSGVCYNIRIQCKKALKPELFTVKEKRSRAVEYAATSKREEKKEFVSIVDVVETEELEDMTCFTVDSPEGLFLCNDYVVTHNTNMLINFAVNAAMSGKRVLFLSLEVSEEVILKRLQAMFGTFRMSLMDKPEEEWTPKELERYNYMLSDAFPYIDYIEVNTEFTSRSATCSDIDREIKAWKKRMHEQGLSDNDCPLVCIDYIHQMDPAGVANAKDNENTKYGNIAMHLRQMAVANRCVIWTAQQTKRESEKKSHLANSDCADAIDIPRRCDVVLGMTLAGVDARTGQEIDPYGVQDGMKVTNESEDDTADNHGDKERLINVDFCKLRNSGEKSTFCTVFQSKSLRLWTSASYADRAEANVERMSFGDFFAATRPKTVD